MLIESRSPSVATPESRALPQLPRLVATNPLLDRLRLIIPAADDARSIVEDDEHYTHIRSVSESQRGGGDTATRSSVPDIRGDVADRDGDDGCGRASYWRSSAVDDPYHYIDIDRLPNQSASGNQIVPPDGYEGRDQAVLPALRQPQRPNSYDRLAAQEAADAGATTEDIEMTAVDAHDESPDVVSRPTLVLLGTCTCSCGR